LGIFRRSNYRGTLLLTGGASEKQRDEMRRDLHLYNVWLAFVQHDPQRIPRLYLKLSWRG
jgi:hypothetical protein